MYLIETERLKLRELVETDFDALHEVVGDAETMRYYPAHNDRAGTARWILRNRESYEARGYGLWAVILKDSDRFLGQCGILDVHIDGEVVPEIAYHINRSFWNQGYATEAARACLEYGFRSLELETIHIHTWVENSPSRRVAEKIGMKQVKEFDKHMSAYGMTWRHVVYASRKTG
jgi:RimJ/RimL family protein N-acetyltransferase